MNLRIQPERRRRLRFSADQLLNKRYMSVINMSVSNHVNQLSHSHVTHLSQHMHQHRILYHIPVIGRQYILGALIQNSI